jgi:N-acetylglutamate synthase-like GNAT family acetyltransferase
MTYSIRKVRTESEKLSVSLLNELLFPLDPPIKLADGVTTWWICRHDETQDIVGFCGLRPSVVKPVVGDLERAGVLPDHRGNGLHRRMIKVRIAECKKQGWVSAVSWTYNNPSSANNLIGEGFRTYKPRKPWGADGAVYWSMRLEG